MSGYDLDALARLLEAAPTAIPWTLGDPHTEDGALIVAAVNALPSMLSDLKLLQEARDSGALRRAATMVSVEADKLDADGSDTADQMSVWLRADAALLRALASPQPKEV